MAKHRRQYRSDLVDRARQVVRDAERLIIARRKLAQDFERAVEEAYSKSVGLRLRFGNFVKHQRFLPTGEDSSSNNGEFATNVEAE